MKVVMDTDVVVAAFISAGGASRQLFVDALDRKFVVLLSTALLVEYEAVLRRPQHLARAGATCDEVAEILDALAGVCVPVFFDYRWRPSGAHQDDELVLETAINGQADTIATFNVRHLRAAAARFGIDARLPGPLVRSMRS
jgi:putative PIN family toxin of toxin-antitoxin system